MSGRAGRGARQQGCLRREDGKEDRSVAAGWSLHRTRDFETAGSAESVALWIGSFIGSRDPRVAHVSFRRRLHSTTKPRNVCSRLLKLTQTDVLVSLAQIGLFTIGPRSNSEEPLSLTRSIQGVSGVCESAEKAFTCIKLSVQSQSLSGPCLHDHAACHQQ